MPGAYARSSDMGFGHPRLAEQKDVAFLKINMGTRGIHGLTRDGIGETGSGLYIYEVVDFPMAF